MQSYFSPQNIHGDKIKYLLSDEQFLLFDLLHLA